MKIRLIALLSIVACTPVMAELTPVQAEAKRSLGKTAQMEEYHGSIFAQARLDGIDYRPILNRAANLDKTALVSLFTMKFMGEGGETHCAVLRDLMQLWGDAKFAEVLVSQPKEVRELVVSSIDYASADPDWISYPRTLAASPASITKRPKAEQTAPSGVDKPSN